MIRTIHLYQATIRYGCAIFRAVSWIPTPAPAPSSLAQSSRPRLTELSILPSASTRLAFRSVPFTAPLHLLQPSRAQSVTFNSPVFSLRSFPSQSRTKNNPTSSRPSPAVSGEDELVKRHAKNKLYTMDLTIMVGKKKVHKSAVIRQRCKRRIKEAIRVAVRGAKVEKEGIVFDKSREGPSHWLVPGFSYIANPTLEIYLHPFPDLVKTMQEALLHTKRRHERSQKKSPEKRSPPARNPRSRMPKDVQAEVK